jgi:hypothetical protein
MATLVSGIMIWYTAGQTIIAGIDPVVAEFGSSRLLGLPYVVYVSGLRGECLDGGDRLRGVRDVARRGEAAGLRM